MHMLSRAGAATARTDPAAAHAGLETCRVGAATRSGRSKPADAAAARLGIRQILVFN